MIRPGHWVVERVIDSDEQAHQFRQKTRRALGMASFRFNVGSRSLTLGALLTAVVGVLASIPLVVRTLFPRYTSRFNRTLGRFVGSTPLTRLQLERTDGAPGPETGHLGYTVDEMTKIAEKVLRELGMTSGFSRLVFVFGHGSTSLNNPHESAHDCGACGGARVVPMRGHWPRCSTTRESGSGWHRVGCRFRRRPSSSAACTTRAPRHSPSMISICCRSRIEANSSPSSGFSRRRANATPMSGAEGSNRPRCRFRSPGATARGDQGGRSVQVRPEWGHATNAICIVGRRERTRGLFLDRRAFLTSYDPTQDDAENNILTRILQAVFPVCAGINLEYYFSYVDNTGWGSGTKLPHNVAALLGVMDGAASDLRTGLPWQMVEIHEPVRILFIIETTVEAMLQIMDRNEGIGKLCRNRWVRLAVLDPATGQLSLFQLGGFRPYQPQAGVLPKAASSVDWYRGWRDHLEFAEIEGQP